MFVVEVFEVVDLKLAMLLLMVFEDFFVVEKVAVENVVENVVEEVGSGVQEGEASFEEEWVGTRDRSKGRKESKESCWL